MPARIRLKRFGTKKKPYYRLVVADATAPAAGKVIEEIGHYSPRSQPPRLELDQERALHWLLAGATPTDTATSLLRKSGVLRRVHETKVARAAEAKRAKAQSAAAPPETE